MKKWYMKIRTWRTVAVMYGIGIALFGIWAISVHGGGGALPTPTMPPVPPTAPETFPHTVTLKLLWGPQMRTITSTSWITITSAVAKVEMRPASTDTLALAQTLVTTECIPIMGEAPPPTRLCWQFDFMFNLGRGLWGEWVNVFFAAESGMTYEAPIIATLAADGEYYLIGAVEIPKERATPYPTYTSYPTYTPYSTYTPAPTSTRRPTRTPIPTRRARRGRTRPPR